MAAKYEVLHLEHRGNDMVVRTSYGRQTPTGPLEQARTLKTFHGTEIGIGAMTLSLFWALPRGGAIYCHRKDGTVEYKITVEHIGGKKII